MNILQKRIQKKSHLQETGGLLYSECLAQARLPSFYTDLDIPDTIDGRFDLLVFHLFIVIYRCFRATFRNTTLKTENRTTKKSKPLIT